ncbi:MAG: hypothetical protein PUD73_05965 [bacterium]|nr:hypothetical protein [bacterium]
MKKFISKIMEIVPADIEISGLIIGFIAIGLFIFAIYAIMDSLFDISKKRELKKKYRIKMDYDSLPDSWEELYRLWIKAKDEGDSMLCDLCTKKMEDIRSGKFDYEQYKKLQHKDPSAAKKCLRAAAYYGHELAYEEYIAIAMKEKNYADAAELYYGASRRGNGKAAFAMYNMYRQKLMPEDTVRELAQDLILGDPLSSDNYNTVMFLYLFLAKEQGIAEALPYYNEVLEDVQQQLYADKCELDASLTDDPREIFSMNLAAAVRGVDFSQYNVCYCFRNAFGTDENLILAYIFARASAQQGYAKAMVMVGNSYLYGKGTEVNEEKGIRWLSAAAEKGNGTACDHYYHNMSIRSDIGPFQSADYENESKRWIKKGIELGDGNCMYNEALLLIEECSPSHKDYKAIKAEYNNLMYRAARKGHEKAQEWLWTMYHQKVEVEKE